MNNGPFKSSEGNQIITDFLMKELFPMNKEIQTLLVDVSSIRMGYFRSLVPSDLNDIEDKHADLLERFMKAYRKWNDPDVLFKDSKMKDPQKVSLMMMDYNQMQTAVGKHIDEAFRMMEQIDRITANKKTTSYNRITMLLSLLAITISTIVAIF